MRDKIGDANFSICRHLKAVGTRLCLDEMRIELESDSEALRSILCLLNSLVDEFTEPEGTNLTFIFDQPEIISPFSNAKCHLHLPSMSEPYEPFANSTVLCSAYTDLNDPEVQIDRFKVSQSEVQPDDDKAMVHYNMFCTAL